MVGPPISICSTHCGPDRCGRAAGRDDLDPGPVQRSGQPFQAGLVVDADESPADGYLAHRCDPPDPPTLTVRPVTDQPCLSMARTVFASRTRSTDLIRSVSVSSSSSSRTATGSWATTGPLSSPASTRNTVQPLTFTP